MMNEQTYCGADHKKQQSAVIFHGILKNPKIPTALLIQQTLKLIQTQHICHIKQAFFFALKPFGGTHGAVGEGHSA